MDENSIAEESMRMQDPHSTLGKTFVEAFLRDKGYTLQSVRELPEEEARRLLSAASQYASCKLAEVEAKARCLKDIHGDSPIVLV